ncbi:MAG TPA: serine/threonine-protein kinase [Gemmatimonadaceae bacterium]|nr:serine/threonine-protein kinase [Gemmatimonadaceae bacterium]
MFDRALWQKARPLFDELVELDDQTRTSRLNQIGAEDPALKDALERLLLADVGETIDAAFDPPSDTPASSSSHDPLGIVGKTVSHFSVKDYLAAGGMGVVYTAEDLQLGRTVALKFPLPHQPLDRLVKERFINEARSAAALDHPNLCTVHEIAESEHGVFLAMPLYPGETLKDRLARDRTLSLDDSLAIVQQIVTGVASAHAAGIVHRDLKPGNVMLLPNGTVKVLDFGLAKIRDISITMSQKTLGTIGYVSPEQVRGGQVDARTDLWAIGVMLYEMTTGTLPFRGEHEVSILHDILHGEPSRPSQVNKTLSPKLDDLIGGLLQKNPDARYRSADALLADIVALRGGSPLSHRSPFWTRTARRRRARRSALPIAVVTALLLIGGVSWSFYRRNAGAPTGTATLPALKFVNNSALISTSAELVAALSPEFAGRRIHVRAGNYAIDRTLVVPDGMTLEGEGRMRFAADGHAIGFADGPRTTVKMTANTGGDLITLGNKVTIRNLEIVDLEGRSGNVVTIASRRVSDTVSATIIESVIVNPNVLGIAPGGALGRTLHLVTRNANLGAQPPPDAHSVLAVKVLRSVISAPSGGGGFYAFNLAPFSRISLDISRSVIGGADEANGGVSRPDAVHDSEVRITSENTVYRNEWADPCSQPLMGWNLTGGSGAPIPLTVPETARNRLIMHSTNDRIEGFTTGVLATGGRRFYGMPRNGPSTDNHIDLELFGTTISTASCPTGVRSENTSGAPVMELSSVADFRLVGGNVSSSAFFPGNGNTVRVEFRGVTGSGKRSNVYADAGGSLRAVAGSGRGTGNRLEFVGDPQTFNRLNHAIDPAPPADFFTAKH